MKARPRPHSRRSILFTLALLAAIAPGGPGAGGEPPVEKQPPPESGRESPRAAVHAVVDPETGELTPGRVEIGWQASSPDLREKLSRRSDDLYLEPLPGGGFMVDLRGRFQTLLVARVGADGELRTECIGGWPGAAAEPAAGTGGQHAGGHDAAGEPDG